MIQKQPRGLPDLVPTDVSWPGCRSHHGKHVSFVARVHDRAGNALDAFVVRFELDGATLGETVVSGLHAGATLEVKSPRWDAEGHRHTIAVFVDALDAVAESDEAINTRAERFEARRRGEHGDRRERHHEPDHH